jgi:putative acetyltransferase
MNIELINTTPSDDEAKLLIGELDADLQRRYPGQPIHGLELDEEANFHRIFLLVRQHDKLVACGVFRIVGSGIGEVKRIYVRPDARGQGVTRLLLGALERTASEQGLSRLHLETGVHQPESIALYESAGYHRIACFGEYIDNPDSVCFQKSISPDCAT